MMVNSQLFWKRPGQPNDSNQDEDDRTSPLLLRSNDLLSIDHNDSMSIRSTTSLTSQSQQSTPRTSSRPYQFINRQLFLSSVPPSSSSASSGGAAVVNVTTMGEYGATPSSARVIRITQAQTPDSKPPLSSSRRQSQGENSSTRWMPSLSRLSFSLARDPPDSKYAELFNRFSVSDFSNVMKKYLTRTFDEDLVFLKELLQPQKDQTKSAEELSPIHEHDGGTAELFKALRTDPNQGIIDFSPDRNATQGGNSTKTEESAALISETSAIAARRTAYGTNAMPARRPTSFFRLAWNVSKDFILRVLMAAGLLSLVLALIFGERKDIEWIEGAAIFMAVLIVVLVTAGNDYLKERQFASICDKDEKFCTVNRGGEQREISTRELLVGDLVLVEAGDEIFADSFVVSARGLAVDESSMTGESTSIKKDTFEACWRERESCLLANPLREKTDHHTLKSPVVISGSTVLTGSARLIVIATGLNSQTGQLLQRLTVDTEPTPLQNKLNAIARDIGNVGFGAAVITLLVLILQYWIIWGVNPEARTPDVGTVLSSHVNFLVEAITIIVVAVPEGLPLAVTLSLAFSVGRMLKDQNYVRRLGACETMGGANEICSDKTGTLTKNIMSVEAFWNGSRQVNVLLSRGLMIDTDPHPTSLTAQQLSSEYFLAGSRAQNGSNEVVDLENMLPPQYMTILIENIAVNSTAYFETITEKTVGKGLKAKRPSVVAAARASQGPTKHVGSPTECALLEFLQLIGGNYEEVREDIGTEKHIVFRLTFSSDRKIMTTVVRCPNPETPNLLRVYVKGASEVVLKLCTTRIDSNGRLRRIEQSQIERIERQVIDQMAGQALRTIGIAYKDFDPVKYPDWQTAEAPFNPLTGGSAAAALAAATRKGSKDHATTARLLDLPQPVDPSRPKESPQENKPATSTYYWMETELSCLGIAGMRDPVREEVPAAVRRCQDAGIRVRMVTGDNIDTAKQIAIRCNIFHPERGGIAMTGSQFYSLVRGVVCEKCLTEICPCTSPVPPPPSSPTPSSAGAHLVVEIPDQEANEQSPDEVPPVKTAPTSDIVDVHATHLPTGHDAMESPRTTTTSHCFPKKKKKVVASPQRSEEETPLAEDQVRGKRNDVLGDFAAFQQIADKLEVMARSQPNDKYALVLGLKALGSVVAVTGDGTNDAPALKKADVGFAMGITGKEVAKQAADIVLLDDNFESIVKAVKWGRNIYDNIRRFLQFQLTVNVVAVVTAFLGSVILRASPLTAVQLLWVNLIMDTLASLALATEPPVESLLDRQPHSRSEYLVNRIMTRNILGQAVYQLVVIFTLIFTGDRWVPERPSSYAAKTGLFDGFREFSSFGDGHSFIVSGRRFRPFSSVEEYKHVWSLNVGPSRHYTIVFNTFVWLQFFNMINCRKIEDEWNMFSRALSNWMWCGIMVTIGVAQLLLVEFGRYALECHLDGLTIVQWLICLGLGAGGLIVQLCLHAVPAQKIKFIPQTGAKEADLLTGPTSLALASRGRFSDRLSARLNSGLQRGNVTSSGAADPFLTNRPRSAIAFPTNGVMSPTRQKKEEEVQPSFISRLRKRNSAIV